ncbi:MAG: entericidin A/B family lipoprotein [Planctomycetota bacterium]
MRTKIQRISAASLASAAGLLLLAGCNTVEGVGRDVEAVGQGVSEGSRNVADAISGNDSPERIPEDDGSGY